MGPRGTGGRSTTPRPSGSYSPQLPEESQLPLDGSPRQSEHHSPARHTSAPPIEESPPSAQSSGSYIPRSASPDEAADQ